MVEVTPLNDGKVELHTPRLTLRPAHIGDLADLHAMMSNDDVMRYWY